AQVVSLVANPFIASADVAVEGHESFLDADGDVAGVVVELGARRTEGRQVAGLGILPPVPFSDEELAAGPHGARECAQGLAIAAEGVRGSRAQRGVERRRRA